MTAVVQVRCKNAEKCPREKLVLCRMFAVIAQSKLAPTLLVGVDLYQKKGNVKLRWVNALCDDLHSELFHLEVNEVVNLSQDQAPIPQAQSLHWPDVASNCTVRTKRAKPT